MARTFGAKDKHKRQFYAGKPVKKKMKRNGKFVPYKSKRRKGDPLKIQIVEVVPMSYDSYMHWNRHIRPKVRRLVFKHFKRIDIDPSFLSSKTQIEEWAKDPEVIGIPGTFDIRMFCHAKNKFHCSPKTVARLSIKETSNGLRVHVQPTRLVRYWFYKNG